MKSNNNIEFETIIKKISQSTGLNDKEISLKVGRNAGYVSQLRSRIKNSEEEVPIKFNKLLKLHFANLFLDNQLKEDEVIYQKKQDLSNKESDLNALIESNRNLSAAKLVDAEAGLLLAKTNASLTAQVLQNINNDIKNEPELLEALNANMRGLLAAIAKVATGTRYDSEDLAVEELGKIVHDKHRKEKRGRNSSAVSN